MSDPKIQFIRVNNAKAPHHGTKYSAGYDIYSNEESEVVIKPGTQAMIDSGIKVAIPHGYYLEVASKSGMTYKLYTSVPTGTIDSDYRDHTIKVILRNSSADKDVVIKRYDPIAQLIKHSCHSEVEYEEVTHFEKTEDLRHDGFGSTHNVSYE